MSRAGKGEGEWENIGFVSLYVEYNCGRQSTAANAHKIAVEATNLEQPE